MLGISYDVTMMKALVLAFSLIMSSQLSSAQSSSPALGHFSGVIQDLKGSKIREARVTVNGVAGFQQKLVSNKRGQFQIDLPPGTYRILVEKSGFASFELTDLEIEPNSTKECIFKLERPNRQS